MDIITLNAAKSYTDKAIAESGGGGKGQKGDKGDKGDNGKSAYEIAVDNGFVGTEEEWLASLSGKDASGDSPVGSIISFMGTTAPKHYLVCDGSVYNTADYPQLTKHIKNAFGSVNFFGGNGTTTFAVPDLRGEFLRGTGTNSHTDCGSGADVGVHQEPTRHRSEWVSKSNQWLINYFGDNDNEHNMVEYADSNCGKSVTSVTTTTQPPVSNTTNMLYRTSRPTNTSVLYCIKYEAEPLRENVYSADEQVIGEYLGKTLYQKVVSVTFPTPSSDGTIATADYPLSDFGIGNVEKFIDRPLHIDSWIASGKTYTTRVLGTETYIRAMTNRLTMGGTSLDVIARYTKTTD